MVSEEGQRVVYVKSITCWHNMSGTSASIMLSLLDTFHPPNPRWLIEFWLNSGRSATLHDTITIDPRSLAHMDHKLGVDHHHSFMYLFSLHLVFNT